MILNLYHRDDNYVKHIVVHEFGHALGLGHEHQMSLITGDICRDKTIDYLMRECPLLNHKDASDRFDADYGPYSGNDIPEKGIWFDPSSIMCYP